MLINPAEVKVREGLERFRKDMGEIEELALSIKKNGQLQPIVINQNNELIAGGRRLAACTLYNMDVLVRVIDETDSLQMRELEIEENIQRKDFTPAEQVLAMKELHEVKQALAKQNSGNTSSWSHKDTAEALGKNQSSVSRDLELAEAVELFPELAKCKSKKELRAAAGAIMKLVDRAVALDSLQETLATTDQATLLNLDAVEYMSLLDDNSVDILLCDPPYGIDISENAIGKGGATGSDDNYQGYEFDDSKDACLHLVELIAQQSYRFCKEDAHAYIFCSPEYFTDIYRRFEVHGWMPWIRPIIWSKIGQGQSNMPDRWPSACYEMCLYARRKNSKLLFTRPDVIQCHRVTPADKVHPTQKPILLLQDLITRSVKPGSILVDPCMGSGSSLVAGIREGLIVKGNDIHKGAYTAAIEYVNQELKNDQAR